MIRGRLIVGVLLAAIALSGCASSTNQTNPNELGFVSADGSAVLKDANQRAEPIDLIFDEIGNAAQWSISDSRGEVVVLNVWGPWCAPCRKEFPELQTLAQALAPEGLEIVGVATRTTETSVSTFVRSQNITFRQVADFDSLQMSSLSGVPSSTVPSSVLIDRQGRIAGWVLGAADPILLKTMVKSLLEETP